MQFSPISSFHMHLECVLIWIINAIWCKNYKQITSVAYSNKHLFLAHVMDWCGIGPSPACVFSIPWLRHLEHVAPKVVLAGEERSIEWTPYSYLLGTGSHTLLLFTFPLQELVTWPQFNHNRLFLCIQAQKRGGGHCLWLRHVSAQKIKNIIWPWHWHTLFST